MITSNLQQISRRKVDNQCQETAVVVKAVQAVKAVKAEAIQSHSNL